MTKYQNNVKLTKSFRYEQEIKDCRQIKSKLEIAAINSKYLFLLVGFSPKRINERFKIVIFVS